jgi:hypothetical protein
MEVARPWRRKSTQGRAVTYIVHASKGDAVAVTIRLRVVAAVAKAQMLLEDGWSVVIISPDDIHYSPDGFDKLLSCVES